VKSPNRNDLSAIPDELKSLPRWVDWRTVLRDDKPTKVPVDPNTGANASSNNPQTWSTFAKALARLDTDSIAGIGFQLGDGIVGCDLDACRNPETGEIEEWAQEIINRFSTYTEISPSGTGVHLVMKGSLPKGGRRKGQIEIYDTGRFFTMTGITLTGTPARIEQREKELRTFHAEIFGAQSFKKPTNVVGLSGDPDDGLTDDQIIQSARQLPKFARLWDGDTRNYTSQSEADLALCGMLLRLTGPNADRIDRLFRKSKLFRAKWDKQSGTLTYGQRTVAKVIENPANGSATTLAQLEITVRNTDLGNAQRLVARHGQDIRYCVSSGKFLVWNGSSWVTDTTGEVERLAKGTVKAMYSEATELPDAGRMALIKHALKSEAAFRFRAMIDLTKSEPGMPVTPEQLDADPWLLNCANGTLDLRTGRLLQFNRENLCTKVAPVEFDPDAECPTWKSFLKRIMAEDSGLIRFLQRAVGYSLTGITAEQVLFFLYGTGANGKTTFVETFRKVVGDYAQQADFKSFLETRNDGARNDLARLPGARFVTAVEAGEGRKLDETTIKQVTGGDTITARFLYHEYFEFTPQFKLFLVANHKPNIAGTDEAIWRRIRLIPFNVTIPPEERDRKLPVTLERELPGILAWAVRGCLDWQKNGLGAPEQVSKATADYRREMDTLADFLEEVCVIGVKESVPASQLYTSFQNWCQRNGEQPMSQKAFGMKLGERGFQKGKTRGDRIWRGLRLPADSDG
jgi:putative DNA primase/helicase